MSWLWCECAPQETARYCGGWAYCNACDKPVRSADEKENRRFALEELSRLSEELLGGYR